MASGGSDSLEGIGEDYCKNFVNNIHDIYSKSQDEVTNSLMYIDVRKLPILRIKLYIKLIEEYPDIYRLSHGWFEIWFLSTSD